MGHGDVAKLAACLLLAGCFNENIPPNTQIACSSNADCPSGHVCRMAIARCVPSDSGDQTPPALEGTATTTPAVARAGVTLTVDFKVTEALASDPVVRVAARPLAVDEAGTNRPAGAYRYSGVVVGNEPQGQPVPVTVDLVDTSGNLGTGLSAGTALFDFTRPSLVTSSGVLPATASAGTQVQVQLAFSEALGGDPVVSMASQNQPAVAWTLREKDPSGKLTFGLAVSGAEAPGDWQVSVVAKDVAGNESAPIELGQLTLDFVAPKVTQTVIDPERARPGQVVLATVTLDERSATLPRLVGAGAGGTLALDLVRQTEERLVFQHVVGSGEDGSWTLTLLGVEDAAGNAMADAVVGTLVVDGTAPGVAGYSQSKDSLSGKDTLVVEFHSTEALREEPLVKLGERAMVREGAGEAPYRYSLALAGTGMLGAFDVQVALADLAGNTALSSPGVVQVDAVPPGVIDVQFSPPVARLDIKAFLSVTVTEKLLAPPVLAWQAGAAVEGDPGFGDPISSGQAYVYTLPVTSSVKPGLYRLGTITLVDRAGNDAVVDAQGIGMAVDFTVDNTPPVVSAVALNGTRFSAQPGFDEFSVSFEVSKPVAEPGGVEVLVGEHRASCVAQGAGHLCTYKVLGSEREGRTSVKISAVDAAGNAGFESASVDLDFTAPSVVAGSAGVQLQPDAQNPLREVTAATAGTTVRLTFLLSELAPADPLVATTSLEPLAFAKASAAGNLFAYTHVLQETAHPQGLYTLQVKATDDVGNAGTSALDPRFAVDTEPPSPPDVLDEGQVTYHRLPWGGADGAKRFRVEGLDGAAQAGSVVRVLESSNLATAGELGRATASASGAFSADLVRTDRPVVYVSAVDGAGNQSEAVDVRDVAWTATLNGKVAGSMFENPHSFETRTLFHDSLWQADAQQVGDPSAISTLGGGALEVRGEGDWVLQWLDGAKPSQRWNHALAYDSRRERAVLLGGWAGAGFLTETWEWNGTGWGQRVPFDPEGDGNPAASSSRTMAYDSARGRVVFFEGQWNGSETWEWDGASWARRPAFDPEGDGGPEYMSGEGGCMAYDAGRERVVLAGGWTDEPWEWDGASWARRPTNDPEGDGNPPPRGYCATAYDSGRGKVALFGGNLSDFGPSVLDDLWEWDGSSWALASPSGASPPARERHSLAYDSARGRLVLFGGLDGSYGLLPGLWEWDGASWTEVSPTDPEGDGNPSARYGHAMVFDSTRGVLLLFGGFDGVAEQNDTWTWNGVSWARLTPGDPQKDGNPTRGGGLAWDGLREKALLFGAGSGNNETWEWAGASWKRRVPTDPEADGNPPYSAPLAYDGQRDRVVLFGGNRTYDTWEWNDASWAKRTPLDPEGDGNPFTWATALAYDAARGRVVLFGGYDDGINGRNGDTWTWDGASWAKWLPVDPEGDGNPGPRDRHAMAYDAGRQRVVLYGGMMINSTDTWEWDGVSWAKRVPADPEGDGNPGHQESTVMTYDAARGVVVLVGVVYMGTGPVVTWEWNGSSWRKRAAADPEGDGSPTTAMSPALTYDAKLQRLLYFRDGKAWTWAPDAERPAQVARFAFASAGMEADAAVREVTATASAAGTGESSGSPLPGAALWRFGRGTWWPGPANSAGVGAPDQVQWSTRDRYEISSLFTGLRQEIAIAVSPAGTNGAGQAAVEVDYLEVTVRYRRGVKANGSACASATECQSGVCDSTGRCSEGAAGSACQVASDCQSGWCSPASSACAVPGNVGDTCGAAEECASGYCSSASGACTDGGVGDSCGGDWECQSGSCDLGLQICN